MTADESRFLRAADEPIAIILWREWTRLRSIGIAPRSRSVAWSSLQRAERFHSVPQALLTTVKLGELRWCSRICKQPWRRRVALFTSVIKVIKTKKRITTGTAKTERWTILEGFNRTPHIFPYYTFILITFLRYYHWISSIILFALLWSYCFPLIPTSVLYI